MQHSVSLCDDVVFLCRKYAHKHGYGVVREFVGHGVGRVFHAEPVVLHYSNDLEPNFLCVSAVLFCSYISICVNEIIVNFHHYHIKVSVQKAVVL